MKKKKKKTKAIWYVTALSWFRNRDPLELTRDENEVVHVAKHLDAADGCISEAARTLDIDRRTLQRRIPWMVQFVSKVVSKVKRVAKTKARG